MYPGQKDKLERYLRNADQFLWGIIPGNKKAVFTSLREMLQEIGEERVSIPERGASTYAMATESLLAKLGIVRVITEIVALQLKREFSKRPGAIDFLRAHWSSGTLPRWQTLVTLRAPKPLKQKILDSISSGEPTKRPRQTADILDAFVQVNTQFEYVRGWTVFAGLWFEEIEPLLKADEGKQTR